MALIKEINELRREIKNLRRAEGVQKPGAGIGASWNGKSPMKRVSKDVKEGLTPPPGYVTYTSRIIVRNHHDMASGSFSLHALQSLQANTQDASDACFACDNLKAMHHKEK